MAKTDEQLAHRIKNAWYLHGWFKENDPTESIFAETLAAIAVIEIRAVQKEADDGKLDI